MKKSYRIAIVLFSAALVVTWASGQPAFGQRLRISTGGLNQGNNKKDKDEQNNNGNSGNSNNNNGNKSQGNQGGNQNNSNAGGSNKSGNSGNSSAEDKIKQYLQNKVNQGQGGNQNQFPGQGNSNKENFGNRGNNDSKFNNGGNSRPWKGDDDDWDHNKNRIKIGSWNGNSWQGSRKVDSWNKAYGNNQKLFSKQWYDDHPHAWNWDNHNHNHKSDVWVVASIPGMYQWLGWGSVPQQYRAYYNQSNVPQFDPSNYGDWYPLGVYSMMTGPDDVGTRVVQLAVDRHGHLNGTYYDMITDNSFQVSGEIQQQTQRAFWTLNSNPNVRFSASVFRLLQPDGNISVQLPGGEQRWQFVRLEN
jgi:hypothetical protein